MQEPLEARTLLSVTPQLIDLNAAGASLPSDFVDVGDTTFFVAEDATNGRELWKTDGTPGGTERVANIRPGADSSDPHGLVELGGKLYFVADDGVHGRELWKSDGTAAGTVLVKDILVGSGHGLGESPSLVNVNGTLYFAADNGTDGNELWKTNGTGAGTVLVKDIFEGAATNHSNPLGLTAVGGTLFFTADDGASGRELWKSTGTDAGTVRVKDIRAGSAAGLTGSASLTNVAGTLFFVADDGTHGSELWKSTGTQTGTVMAKDMLTGSGDGLTEDDWLVDFNGTLFFTAKGMSGTELSGTELWKWNGTDAVLVKDIYPGKAVTEGYVGETHYTAFEPYSSSPRDLTVINGMLFFSAENFSGANGTGRELWKSDGTPAGTVMVKDVFPDSVYNQTTATDVPNSSSPQHLAEVGGKLFFSADDGAHGRELWTSDGTPGGTVLVDDIVAGGGSSSPQSLFDHDGTLLFSADDGVAGRELYTTVPEAAETLRVARLSIYVNGQRQAIPAKIGVASGGARLAQVHTPDANGTLRVQPIGTEPLEDVTLGDFFDTWRTKGGQAGNNANAVFNEDEILNKDVDAQHTIQVFVNGQADRRFDDYVIQNGDEIVIVYTANEIVSLNTNVGSMLIELYGTAKPISVTNFLKYINDGDYINSFFHRSDDYDVGNKDFVIQGGGYKTSKLKYESLSQFSLVPTDPAIQNEPGISNTRGTIAMARGSGVNSATSQFYINMSDNGTAEPYKLDTQNQGFTVFGRVLDMTVADTIAKFDVTNVPHQTYPFSEVPFTDDDELVVIQSIGGEGDLAGTAFKDLDLDRVRDTGEVGLGGVTVFADANDNGVRDAGEYSTVADSAGNWSLRLPAGTWVIRQQPSGTLYPTTAQGTGGHTVTVKIGDEVDGLNFANIAKAPPVAVADSYSVNEDATLTKDAAAGVLANDTPGEGGSLTAVVIDQPKHGTLTLSTNGSFTYDPADNFFGTDTFTYRAKDTYTESATVAVTINVLGQPDAPNAVNDQITLPEGIQTHKLNVLNNDTTDPDGPQTLLIKSVTQGSKGGTVAKSSDGLTIDYKPTAGFVGTETFTYTVEDADGLTDTATVTVTVSNEALGSISGYVYRDADNDGQRDTGEMGIYGVRVRLTGVDGQGNSVTKSAITSHSGLYRFDNLPRGTYKVTEQQPAALLDGKDSIGTAGGNLGNDRLSNIVLDANEDSTENNFGEGTLLPQFVTLGMFLTSKPPWQQYLPGLMADAEETAGNTTLAAEIREKIDGFAPVVVNDTYNATEDQTYTKDAANGVLKNDSDPDEDTLTASKASGPSHGTLTFNANGSFTYVPTANYSGPDSFTYTVSDGTHTSAPATVTINVAAVNDKPVAVDDTYTVTEDVTRNVDAANGVLNKGKDSDPDGDALTALLAAGPSHGTLTLNANGSFTYVPTANYSGPDSFTYTVTDGTLISSPATVTITVNAVNDTPIGTPDTYTVTEDTTYTADAANGVLANDTDPDGDSRTAAKASNPLHGTLTLNANGSFTYVPTANYSGPDGFTYTVSDGTLTSAPVTVTINVGAVNDAPIAADDSYPAEAGVTLTIAAPGVLANDSDVDDDPTELTAVEVDGPDNGTLVLQSNGSFTYTPNPGFHGEDSFTYQAYDGSAYSNVQTVTLVVNTPPAALPDSYTVYQDQPRTFDAPGVLSNDLDADGDVLKAYRYSSPAAGTVNLEEDGSFTYTPSAGFTGTVEFFYQAYDGTKYSVPAKVTIEVKAFGAVEDGYDVDKNEQLIVLPGNGVLANDVGLSDAAVAELVDDVDYGTLVFEADGSFTYEPDEGFIGPATFTYKVIDGDDESEETTVTIDVTSEVANDAPVARGDEYSVNKDESLDVNADEGVLDNDVDVDGSPASPLTSLRVTEVNYNPHDATDAERLINDDFDADDFEFIELTNVGEATIDLTGVAFVDGISFDFTGSDVTELAPGQTVLVVADRDAFEARYGTGLNVAGEFGSGELNNGGETIALEDSLGNTIQEFTYDDEGDWPTDPDGDGYTLEVLDPAGDYDDPFNWLASEQLGGTPGDGADPIAAVDYLMAQLVTGPAHAAQFTFHDDGSFTYVPDGIWTGTDHFTYKANDGTDESEETTVDIEVTSPGS